MGDTILEARDVSFSYEAEEENALDGLSLTIERGKRVAFMGSNGSGKSTFFLCCNGINRPQRGTLLFDGKPLDYSKEGLLDLRSKVGIVFQDPDDQLFSASVYQEISFGILNLGVSEEVAKEEVEKVIGYLEITPFRHKPTHALSGGQKKQVSIADILVMHPEIIILDEPASALDPKHTEIVDGIVEKLSAEGITIMMATHDVDHALEWADEVILLQEGKVLMHGDPVNVFSNKTALALCNLTQPVVMQMFDRMCAKGILKPWVEVPRNLAALESYIEKADGCNEYLGGRIALAAPARTGILVVSFGTSHRDTRAVTIDAIERDIQEAFPDYPHYRAWTSGVIMAKVLERDGMKVMNVAEAMRRMLDDGITDVVIQPTHVINGVENDRMKEDALAFKDEFHSIRFGAPLLTSPEDGKVVIEAVAEEFADLEADEALVLMGHGTRHYANAIYAALDYEFKDRGHDRIFLGTVEAYPSMESLMKLVARSGVRRIRLAPFMIVAGEHAKKDLSGTSDSSWYRRFRERGYETRCVLRGLGEYERIRELFIEHVRETLV